MAPNGGTAAPRPRGGCRTRNRCRRCADAVELGVKLCTAACTTRGRARYRRRPPADAVLWGCHHFARISALVSGSDWLKLDQIRRLVGARLASTNKRVQVTASSGRPSLLAQRCASVNAPGSQPRCEAKTSSAPRNRCGTRSVSGCRRARTREQLVAAAACGAHDFFPAVGFFQPFGRSTSRLRRRN